MFLLTCAEETGIRHRDCVDTNNMENRRLSQDNNLHTGSTSESHYSHSYTLVIEPTGNALEPFTHLNHMCCSFHPNYFARNG